MEDMSTTATVVSSYILRLCLGGAVRAAAIEMPLSSAARRITSRTTLKKNTEKQTTNPGING